MNFAAGGDYVMVNTPAVLRAMARRVQELGVRPELEVFDTGHMVLVKELIARGPAGRPGADPALHRHPLRRPRRPGHAAGDGRGAAAGCDLLGLRDQPDAAAVRGAGACWSGGNVRVGLEDNLYLSRGVLATNGELVERAVRILEAMNVRVLGPDEVRERLGAAAPWLSTGCRHRSACSAPA